MLKVVKYKTGLYLYFYLERLYLTTVGLHSQMAVMDWSWITVTYCDDYFSTIPTTPYCLFNMRASHLMSGVLRCTLVPLTESTISAYLVPYHECKETVWGCCVFVILGPIALYTFPAWPTKTLRLQVQAGGKTSAMISVASPSNTTFCSSPSDAVPEGCVLHSLGSMRLLLVAYRPSLLQRTHRKAS